MSAADCGLPQPSVAPRRRPHGPTSLTRAAASRSILGRSRRRWPTANGIGRHWAAPGGKGHGVLTRYSQRVHAHGCSQRTRTVPSRVLRACVRVRVSARARVCACVSACVSLRASLCVHVCAAGIPTRSQSGTMLQLFVPITPLSDTLIAIIRTLSKMTGIL